MENKNYVVCRDNIYVGEVVRTDHIYRYNGEDYYFKIKTGALSTGIWKSYRSMLFVPNENKLSNDLLYRTPNYPILNITDDKICLNLGKNSIVIKDACNLSQLLKYFNYGEELTYDDIIKIRKTFFTGRFAKDNCKLFGMEEIMSKDLIFYTNGEKIKNSKELERRRRQFMINQYAGHRMFFSISESPLPREYFDVIDARGDSTLIDVIKHLDGKINAFHPPVQEGPVKKLKKF